jgi:hypothetical protein
MCWFWLSSMVAVAGGVMWDVGVDPVMWDCGPVDRPDEGVERIWRETRELTIWREIYSKIPRASKAKKMMRRTGRTTTMAGDEEDCHNQSKGRKRISQRINQQEMKRVVVLLLQRRVV